MRRVAAAGSLAALAAVAALGLSACTSTTSGTGSSGAGSSGTGASSSVRPSAAPSRIVGTQPPSSSSVSPSTTAAPKSHLSITVASSGVTYDVTVWDHDDIADCSTHAYGEAMIRFLGAHPCRGAHRVLGTVPLNGRTVAVSAITTSFAGTPTDPYATTAQFIKLEQADCSCAVNDLLREGGTLPGAQNIPPTEAFSVLSQDAGVTIFDAWYLDGATPDQDPPLVTLERNLFLTAFTRA